MSSWPTMTRRCVANSPMTCPDEDEIRVMVLGV
jgi:hypothetical protein